MCDLWIIIENDMKHASLFSGIGAPELAAYWLGWENSFHCEINPFCRQVLNYWFEKSESYEDITKTDFKKWRGEIDVLSGGFPCQPFSVAGKRKGSEDNRYLWPEFRRAIREIYPRWVIGENVAGIVSMVQPGKEIDMEVSSVEYEKGDKETLLEQEFVIETICRDLECEGYTVQPIVIPACSVGAPHRRDRVWFIAHNNSFGLQEKRSQQPAAGDSRVCVSRAFPTPQAMDSSAGAVIGRHDRFIQTKTGHLRKINQNGQNGSIGLARLAHLMNTPTASDWKGGSTRTKECFQHASLRGEVHADYGTGKTSQLNPLFVEEMMGFPNCWMLMPFLKESVGPENLQHILDGVQKQ